MRNELEESLTMDEKDFDDERRVHRANVSALEAEIRRLNAEVRNLRESHIDVEATQLALEHGFLSPFGASRRPRGSLFSSTPQSSSKMMRFGNSHAFSPQIGLNASTILDDEDAFSFDSWAASPASSTAPSLSYSLGSSKVDASPTSKLLFRGNTQQQSLAQSFRPKPILVSGSTQQHPQYLPNGHKDSPIQDGRSESHTSDMYHPPLPLAPHPTAIDSPSRGAKNRLLSTNRDSTPQMSSRLSPLKEGIEPTPPSSPTDFNAPPTSSSKSPHGKKNNLWQSSASTPSHRSPEISSRNDTPLLNKQLQRFQEASENMHSFQITPKNGPFAKEEEPTPKILTRLVYVPRTSHWCEQLFQIIIIVLVVLISFSFGIVFSQTGGPPDWLFGAPRSFLS